jgi:uncharacterized repeat protein (TIGR01451 family)
MAKIKRGKKISDSQSDKMSGEKLYSSSTKKKADGAVEKLVSKLRTDNIEKELSTIYLDGEDAKSDMTKLEQARHPTFKKILVGALIFLSVLAGISALGFFYFGRNNHNFTGEQIVLSIDGPEEIKSGEPLTYSIKYHNTSDIPLGTASLELHLPEGFQLATTEPAAAEKNTWKIGSLAPWELGQINFSGFLLSPIDKESDIQAVVTYRPANFNSEFQKVATKTVRAIGSVLELEISGPSKSLPGDKVELSIKYRNSSDMPIKNIVLRTAFPTEFIFESSEPATSNETRNEWRSEILNGQEEKTITVAGTFASEAQGLLTLPLTLGFLTTTDNYVEQTKTELTTEVLQGQLVAALAINGKSENQTARLGDELRFSVSYRNTGEASLGNTEIAVIITATTATETSLLLWNELEDANTGTLKDHRITWTSKQIKSLSRLEAGDQGIIEFTVPIITETSSTTTDNLILTSWVESFIESIDGNVVNRTTQSQPLEIRMLSDTKITADARFYDENGLALGSGVIPPEVGRETTYVVNWRITNSLHELSDLQLAAKLPDGVEWNGKAKIGAGDLRFDSTERKMIWTLNWLPQTVDEIEISFEVTIIPTEGQRNRIPTLVDALVFEARDNAVEAVFSLSQPPITTSLNNDPRALGKGRVR